MSTPGAQLYANMRDNVALNLLKQFGFAAAILVKSGEVFNPVTGTVTTQAKWFAFNCLAVYGGSGQMPGVSTQSQGKTLTRQRTKQVYVDASLLTIQPLPDDLFLDENGNTFEILRVENYNPGAVTVMWKLTTKR